jgi:hypothetical protein
MHMRLLDDEASTLEPEPEAAAPDVPGSVEREVFAPPAPPAPAPAQPAEAKEAAERHRREEPVQPQAPPPMLFGEGTDAPDEPPQFAAYYPEAVKPNHPYVLIAFVFFDFAREQVDQIAKGYAAMMGGTQASANVISQIKIPVGSLITFVPVVEGIRFNPPEQLITWQSWYQSATFLFTTPTALPQTLTGRVLVYQGPLIIGEIPLSMQVVTVDQPVSTTPGKSGEMQRLQPVFASYSHRDTPVMEYFRRSYERLGQKMLVDVYDLRSGEHWADRLLEMIGESAVFQLFWSYHSAQSKYCRQEWESALKYLDERPRFIRPVWWQHPMPAPPPELSGLHFQRVPLPVLTRMQVIAAKVRGLLK